MRLLILFCLILTSSLMATTKVIVGIAGGTGSGKTTLSEKILETFPDRAVLICQDSYYRGFSHLAEEERSRQNFDHPDSIDFDLLKSHLLLLKNNKPIEVPIYNFRNYARENYTQSIEPAEIIILEGILLFAVPEIRALCDLKIFVETDDDIRLLRRMERDMNERARNFESVRDQYITTVKPMHYAFVEPSKRHADVIFPSLTRNEAGIAMILSSLKEDLDYIANRQ
jgi:uridine kinase